MIEIFTFFLFLYLSTKLFRRNIGDVVLHDIKDVQQEDKVNNIEEIIHEIYEGNHYFFDVNDRFICQGSSLKDAAIRYAEVNGDNFIGIFLNKETNKKMCFFAKECNEVLNVVAE